VTTLLFVSRVPFFMASPDQAATDFPPCFAPGAAPWWREPRGRPLATLGGLLVVSGLAHLVVWAVQGGPWEGAVTWRKPILFGISGGLTSLSLGWVWSRLPWRRGDGWLAPLTAWALFVEVALIDLQRWRGVPSHFNRATPLDSFLYDAMGVLIIVVTLVAADLTLRLLRQPTDREPDMLAAARAGLVLLVVSCVLGIWVSVHGDLRVARGLSPEVYGAAGVPKFPHGAAIHALQWLPLVAWAGRRAGLSVRRRCALVHAATVGSVLVMVYALVQTLAGRARFDAPPEAASVLVAGGLLLGGSCLLVGAAWIGSGWRSPRMSRLVVRETDAPAHAAASPADRPPPRRTPPAP
jgi:hypothetical protein